MLRSSLCDYSDPYIFVKGTTIVGNKAAANHSRNNGNKKVTFKNCTPFTNCIKRINNKQVYDTHDIDVIMTMYNLIEYGNYSKTSEILWLYCRDEPAVDPNG